VKILLIFGLLLAVHPSSGQPGPGGIRTLIVIFDGLRHDYITAENMPNLYSLKKSGGYGMDNHSVFPTVTRVNASSYVTGSYPATHGLLGNTVYFPEVDKTQGLNTGDVNDLILITDATGNKLLTTVSLGELLSKAGEKLMVFSSGSSGQAFLQNHTVSGGGVIHPEVIVPSDLKEEIIKTIGNAPAPAKPNFAQHAWVTRALLHYGLTDEGPLVSALWLSDPDGTAHSEGIGAPLSMESIRYVDQQLGNIIQELKKGNNLSRYNIIITSDHGFVTDVGTRSIPEFLVDKGLKAEKSSDDVVIAGNAIFVKDRNPVVIRNIVYALQEQPWVGAIFTRSASGQRVNGWVEGTLAFETIHLNHESRTADILVDYNWNDSKNEYGYAGTSFAKGTAGHGGSSPYEIHIPLIVSGPAFKRGYESALPTSNTDIAPTVLYLHGLSIPTSMDGRVLKELLVEAPEREKDRVKKEVFEASVRHPWGTYHVTLERSIVGKQHYVNFTKVTRETTRE
jgi:predicted AlkP superfamily pyrophosphatase or phosphodiesterase